MDIFNLTRINSLMFLLSSFLSAIVNAQDLNNRKGEHFNFGTMREIITTYPSTNETISKENKVNIIPGTFEGIDLQKSNPSGTVGPRGEKGDSGERGERGQEGIKGGKGNRGEHGARGDNGQRGHMGGQGPRGVQGPKGVMGMSGKSGTTGHRGTKGHKGDVGPPGVNTVKNYNNDKYNQIKDEKCKCGVGLLQDTVIIIIVVWLTLLTLVIASAILSLAWLRINKGKRKNRRKTRGRVIPPSMLIMEDEDIFD